jgi:hypothetical protein
MLHHWTTMPALAGIVDDGEVRPCSGEPWMPDAVVWLTTGSCAAFFDTKRFCVCLEVDPIWADAEPFNLAQRGLWLEDGSEWFVSRRPIPFRRVSRIVVDGRGYRSATYDGETLKLAAR